MSPGASCPERGRLAKLSSVLSNLIALGLLTVFGGHQLTQLLFARALPCAVFMCLYVFPGVRLSDWGKDGINAMNIGD